MTSTNEKTGLTLEDIRAVSPALARYTEGPLLTDLWKGPACRREIAAS
jgi:hypothetical protein